MDNDPSGVLRALDEIEKLKKELRDQRAEFDAQIRLLKASQEGIVEFLKGTASKADLEQVREGVIVASEMVRTNIVDVIAAAAARMTKAN